MSLYDDIVIDKSTNDKSGWSSSSGIKLLQDHLQSKKALQQQNKRDIRKSSHNVAPVLGLGKRIVIGDEMPPPPVIATTNLSKGSLLGGDWDLSKEYDPLWPNDYEKIMKERRERNEREREEEKAKELEERQRRKRERFERNVTSLGLDYDDDDDDEDVGSNHKSNRSSVGAAIAPPPSLLPEVTQAKEKETSSFGSAIGVSSVAAKIMAKMGYKEGQGLGRDQQGMSTALQVESTFKGLGKIIHEKDNPMPPPPPPPPPSFMSSTSSINESKENTESITEMMKNPSKIVLLKNMVGPGEVDDDLEPETKEECGKYGEVIKCVIFELTGDDVPDDEAVRIFIEFKRVESAIKAVVDLNGRYFGGRVVKATFYNSDRFKNLQLKD